MLQQKETWRSQTYEKRGNKGAFLCYCALIKKCVVRWRTLQSDRCVKQQGLFQEKLTFKVN